jgi:hypothetical protein
MSDMSKILRAFAALVVAIALGTLIGWLASRQGDVTPIVAPPSTNQTLAIAPAPVQIPAPAPEPIRVAHKQAPAQVAAPTEADAADWEQRLDDILLGDDDDNGKSDKILALIPAAPPDAQHELAQHLVNMTQDDHYDGAAGMLTNAATPPDVSDVLMNDLLNRNNNLKLPLLLAIARNDQHPLKDQALNLLGLLTQEDDGTNWDQWSSTVDTWLQDNPQ